MDKSNLSDRGRKIYNGVRRKMKNANLYESIDEPLICLYAHTLCAYEDVTYQIDDDGFLMDGAQGGKVKHPLLAVQKGYLEQLTKIAKELKITPLERTKGAVPNTPKTRKLDALQSLRKAK